jgi:metal-responsive CopG/Arc/MetJ family transcriptional regulator
MAKREELITVRIEPKLKEKIKALEKEKIETRSNIIREALIKYLQKESEIKEIKKVVAEKFASNLISFEELVRIVGYEEARKIAFYVEIAKKSFEEGLR